MYRNSTSFEATRTPCSHFLAQPAETQDGSDSETGWRHRADDEVMDRRPIGEHRASVTTQARRSIPWPANRMGPPGSALYARSMGPAQRQ
jgi:hypothetical protein